MALPTFMQNHFAAGMPVGMQGVRDRRKEIEQAQQFKAAQIAAQQAAADASGSRSAYNQFLLDQAQREAKQGPKNTYSDPYYAPAENVPAPLQAAQTGGYMQDIIAPDGRRVGSTAAQTAMPAPQKVQSGQSPYAKIFDDGTAITWDGQRVQVPGVAPQKIKAAYTPDTSLPVEFLEKPEAEAYLSGQAENPAALEAKAKVRARQAKAQQPAKRTDGQRQAEFFYNQMATANKTLESIIESDPDYDPGSFVNTVAGAVHAFAPAKLQKYRNAANAWIRAKLRKESGAVIGEDEMEEEYRTFFPVLGDGPDVIEQKRIARAQASRSMQELAGLSAPDEPSGGLTPEEEAELRALERELGLAGGVN